jgi:hypothetical protein
LFEKVRATFKGSSEQAILRIMSLSIEQYAITFR